jgi:ankyrin repeat protein
VQRDATVERNIKERKPGMITRVLISFLVVASTSLFAQQDTAESFKTGFFVLTRAAEGDYDDVTAYVANSGDIDFQDELGIGFLHVAVIQGNEKEVQRLLAQGANPNLPTRFGITPLHIASSTPTSYNVLHFTPWMKTAPQIVKDLLKAGADPNRKNSLGQTALHLCSSTISTDQNIERLGIVMPRKIGQRIKAGSVSTVIGYLSGISIAAMAPLYIAGGLKAVAYGAAAAGIAAAEVGTGAGAVVLGAITLTEIARRFIVQVRSKSKRLDLLLEYGANVNSLDNFDNTPLHYLAGGKLKDIGIRGRRGSLVLASRLKKAKSNLTLRNDKGYTAYDLAKLNNRFLLEPLLNPGKRVRAQLLSLSPWSRSENQK